MKCCFLSSAKPAPLLPNMSLLFLSSSSSSRSSCGSSAGTTAAELGATARGRLPRLAIVDAMGIDSRRRLVLVRRDNVEHLLLIGGPTDIVVEPQIVRTRAPTATTQRPALPTQSVRSPAQSAAAPPPPPPPPPQSPAVSPAVRRPGEAREGQPIPFAPRRMPIARAGQRAEAVRPVAPEPGIGPEPSIVITRRTRPIAAEREPADDEEAGGLPALSASARFEETTRPTRVEQIIAEEAALVEAETEMPPVPEEDEAPLPAAAVESEPEPPAAERETPQAPAMESEPELPDFLEAPATAGEIEEVQPPAEGDTAAKVSDLEKEMARLLGEISGRRSH